MKKHIFLTTVTLLLGAVLLMQCKPKNAAQQVTFNPSQTAGGKVVFLDLDTLYTKYNLYIDAKKQLEDDYKKADAAFGAKLEAFQKRAGDFQRRVMETEQRANEIAPVELKKLEAEFGAQQRKLAEEEQSLSKQRDAALGDLDKKIQDLQKDIKGKIDQYLEKIAAERGYDYVMIKGAAQGGVLYGNKNLDITAETLQALNAAYTKK